MMSNNDSSPDRSAGNGVVSRGSSESNLWWFLPPILSFGWLGWVGFYIAARRTGMSKYQKWAWIYGGIAAIALLLMMDAYSAPTGLLAFAWFVSSVHAFAWNAQLQTDLAANANSNTQQVSFPGPQPNSAASPPPFGIDTDEYYGPSMEGAAAAGGAPPPTSTGPAAPRTSAQPRVTRPSTPVNVNAAASGELAALGGVGDQLARRIVAEREARGPYRDLDDLIQRANLQPHEFNRVRGQVVVPAEPVRRPQTQPPGGRRLDY